MKKIMLAALFSIFMLSAMVVPSLSQEMTVGVQVGDWFKYVAEVTQWESEDPFLPDGFIGPLSLYENETNYILYTVTDITPGDGGDIVNFTITYDWKNGSQTEATTGEIVSTANTGIFMIGADMEPGDMVSDNWDFFGIMTYPQRFINETAMVEYGDITRETNICEYNLDVTGTPYTYRITWDKATGMRVWYENWGDVPAIFTSAYEYTVIWMLIESSVWVVPEFPTGTVMLLVFVAVTVCVDIYRRKKLKRRIG